MLNHKNQETRTNCFLLRAAAALLVLLPVYTTPATLIEVNGTWVLLPLFVPVALTVLPLIFQERSVWMIATILLNLFFRRNGS